MPTSEELTTRFTDPAGFKKYFGFMGGGRAKKAHELFTTADTSGVSRAYGLDQREHEGSLYFIKAVSTAGDLDEATLASLTSEAREVALGSLHYDGMMANTLPAAIDLSDDGSTVHNLSRFDDGIIVYPVSIMSKKAEASFAVWARKGGKFYVLPLEDKKL